MMKNKPVVYVIAGPNGAGKTTFATRFLPRYVKCLKFINPDLIAWLIYLILSGEITFL